MAFDQRGGVVTGLLKAKVDGLWVPVRTQGPQGGVGPVGPPSSTPRAKGRAATASLRFPGTFSTAEGTLLLSTPILNDGWSFNGVQLLLLAAGRFRFAASVSLNGGVAQNYFILNMRLIRNKATVRQWSVVCQNVTAGYRAGYISGTADMLANDQLYTSVQCDTAGAGVDTRSWLTMSEVAW